MKTDLGTLKRAGQEPKYNILVTLLHRKISIRITKVLLPTGITPNQVTLFCLLLGIASAALFFLGGYWCILAGALTLNLQEVFDCVDGEIARIKGLQSKTGKLLDAVTHIVTITLVYMALAFSVFNASGSFWIWPVVVLCLSGMLSGRILGLAVRKSDIQFTESNRVDQMIASSRFAIGWSGGMNEAVILLGALLNQMLPALIAIAFFENAEWMARLLLNMKRTRRMWWHGYPTEWI